MIIRLALFLKRAALLLLLFHTRCRGLEMIFYDRLTLVYANIIELAKLLLDHPQVILSICMQNPTIIVCDNYALVQILTMLLVEFSGLFLTEKIFLGSLNDLICLLKIISCISLHLRITTTLLITAKVDNLLVCGQATRKRLHLTVFSTARVFLLRTHDKRS